MVELVKRPSHPQPSADQLAAERDRAIELSLLMTGRFDAQIAELKKQREALEARQLLADTIEDAQMMRAEAEEYAAGVRKDADAALAEAHGTRAEADRLLAVAKERSQSKVDDAERQAGAIVAAANERAKAINAEADDVTAHCEKKVLEAEARLTEIAAQTAEAQKNLEGLLERIAAQKSAIAAALGL